MELSDVVLGSRCCQSAQTRKKFNRIERKHYKMPDKTILSSPIPVIHDHGRDKSVHGEWPIRAKWIGVLQRVWCYLKGGNKEGSFAPDPATPIIAAIADREVARIVHDLHYKTPKSLMAMRKSCQECFMLPDDCPYYDYSIFDVKKAIKRLVVQPEHTHEQVVKELGRINLELATHLADYLED